MEQKIIFREMLSEIKALADSKNNRLTTEEIDQFFANAQLERTHMEMIYDYLVSQKIQVEGYKGKQGNPFPDGVEKMAGGGVFREKEQVQEEKPAQEDAWEESSRPVSMELYLEEIGRLQQLDPASQLELFRQAVAGDGSAKKRLVELYLPMVCELAGDYDGDELPVEDLIQEGNIGLLLTMEQLEERDSLAAYQVQVMNAVNEHMQNILGENRDLRDLGNGIAQRVNHLSQAIHNLEEDLEHRVSVEELSAYLEMPAEEIRAILKMAGDELEVEEGGV